MGQRLELRPQHVVLLGRELELADPLRDREPVEASEPVEREQRVMRRGERLLHAVDEAGPAAVGDRVALRHRAGAPQRPHEPRRLVGIVAERDREPGARDLRPRVGLVPVHPAAAVFDRNALPRRRPRAAAESLSRLEQEHRTPALRSLARRRDPGEAAADDDHVMGERGRHRRLRSFAIAMPPRSIALDPNTP